MSNERFGQMPQVTRVPDPTPSRQGAVIAVSASGVCRSDWFGWAGHDPGIVLPHVPGHELAGTVVAVGAEVSRIAVGDRVTVPFVGGCGRCSTCHSGNPQVCPDQFQPGFTAWGSFAQLVAIDRADYNLVKLPENINDGSAAALGCRLVTAFRGVIDIGQVRAGEWVVVHGCGGVGLSAIMLAEAAGARVIAVDLTDEKLKKAEQLGAELIINASQGRVAEQVIELTGGGAQLSLDCIGHPAALSASINGLARRGRHVQLGLLEGEHQWPAVPMARVLALELAVFGGHGMQAFRYEAVFQLIASGRLKPDQLIERRIALSEAAGVLTQMQHSTAIGITLITDFDR